MFGSNIHSVIPRNLQDASTIHNAEANVLPSEQVQLCASGDFAHMVHVGYMAGMLAVQSFACIAHLAHKHSFSVKAGFHQLSHVLPAPAFAIAVDTFDRCVGNNKGSSQI